MTAAAEPEAEQVEPVTVRVNGCARTATVPVRRLLSDFLRHDLRLTGTHVGCEHGVCGCCTVLLDGAPVRACLLFAVSVDGHDLTTVEGLSTVPTGSTVSTVPTGSTVSTVPTGSTVSRVATVGGAATGGLGPVQRAFQECHALQCGFCTPGFLTTVTAFLAEHPDPTEEEVVEAISGNLCRCTGYQNIVAATLRAAELSRPDAGGRP